MRAIGWGKRFRLPTILCLIALAQAADPTHGRETVPAYPSPIELAISANGSRLYVVCEGTNEVVEIDPIANSVRRRVRVGQHPKSISLSSDGRFLYVANSWSDTVSVIGVETLKVLRELPGGIRAQRSRRRRGRPFPLRGQPHEQRCVGDRSGARSRRPSACWRAAAPPTCRSRRTAAAFTARISIRSPPPSARHPNRK